MYIVTTAKYVMARSIQPHCVCKLRIRRTDSLVLKSTYRIRLQLRRVRAQVHRTARNEVHID